MPISDHALPKIIEITFSFLQFAPEYKISVHSIYHSWDTVSFRVLWQDWPHPFMTMSTQKVFDQLLIYMNLYQLDKSGYFIHLFWRYGWLKNLAIWWLRTFWPISQEQKFSQIWYFCRNIASNTSFHYRTNSVKINDQICQ